MEQSGYICLIPDESRALATMKLIVHVDEAERPLDLFVMAIDMAPKAIIYKAKDAGRPADWRTPGNSALKSVRDKLIATNKFLALKVRPAVIPFEYKYILNPQYPRFKRPCERCEYRKI